MGDEHVPQLALLTSWVGAAPGDRGQAVADHHPLARALSQHLLGRQAQPQQSLLGAEVLLAAIGVLELGHLAWTGGSVSQAVLAAGEWWIPLHLLLIAGYGLLVALLWPPVGVARILLGVFVVCNTVFLGIDGLGVGLLVQSDPNAADAVWNAPLVIDLANVTGAVWAAALLELAAVGYPARGGKVPLLAIFLTWLVFVASVAFPVATPASRVVAVATGAWVVYRHGAAQVPFALFVFAAVLRQHVGPEAALGLACIAVALALKAFRERSNPAAESRL